MKPSIVVLDFGSQYTQLIARSIRQLGVYCEIHPYSISFQDLKALEPSGIILSGGPASVTSKTAPKVIKKFLDMSVPVLGICYGMQLLSFMGKGAVNQGATREYGFAQVEILNPDGLFLGFEKGEKLQVWMSHGDSVEVLPQGAELTARSESCPVAGFQMGSLYGLQFHPEVAHTLQGDKILSNFLFGICDLSPDWEMENFFHSKSEEILRTVGERDMVIGAVSGGVDSTLLAVFLGKILGKRFHPVLVDHGLMRLNEAEEVAAFLGELGVPLTVIKAERLFLKNLAKVSDPEKKRKIIGKTFIEVFEKECKKFKNAKFLAQGTLYPDVIESVSVKGPSHTIKTHHNVGGLPKRMKLKLIEPFRELFKDEVRQLGRTLGVPDWILGRHPFPGPGLAVRVLGEVSRSRLDLLRKADAIFVEELKSQGLYDQIWQALAALLPVRAVGVMGDARTYESVVALRAVTSRDGMTADWFDFEKPALGRIANRIINEVPGINRVVYDVSSKPPATIEWE
ncbi:MAG: glutamine-hydrolyzing GMP synthase [Bdellovibrionales bacterium]|nr:glutamine-hydrolyzing GMP synthase [Bdellovibrionales bacterium]